MEFVRLHTYCKFLQETNVIEPCVTVCKIMKDWHLCNQWYLTILVYMLYYRLIIDKSLKTDVKQMHGYFVSNTIIMLEMH